jgi:Condensation domain.
MTDIENIYAHRPLSPRRPFKPMIKYLSHLDRTTGLNFWRRHLQNATPTSFLQTLPGAPRTISNETVTREVHIEHGSLVRQFGIMASTLVTGAWSIVLAAHSNCSDVVFGQILAGRSTHHSVLVYHLAHPYSRCSHQGHWFHDGHNNKYCRASRHPELECYRDRDTTTDTVGPDCSQQTRDYHLGRTSV